MKRVRELSKVCACAFRRGSRRHFCSQLCGESAALGRGARPRSREPPSTAEEREDSAGAGNGGGWEKRRRHTLSLPTVSAPEELQGALRRVLGDHTTKQLVADGQGLMRHLMGRRGLPPLEGRRGRRRRVPRVAPARPGGAWPVSHSTRDTAESVLRYGRREVLAYAASRLQAVYGATLRVLSEIATRDSSFCPETMLDFGSGLGTAVWAAHRTWPGQLYETQTVDTSSDMGSLARRLRIGGREEEEEEMMKIGDQPQEVFPGVYFRQYLPTSNVVQYDLVTACYSLGDLQSPELTCLSLTALWRKTRRYLVLLEIGNTAGFQNIIAARDFVLGAPNWVLPQYHTHHAEKAEEESLEGHVFAPCPHSLQCPMAGGSVPCRFGQRVALDFCDRETLKHRGHKIETFSYVVLKKGPREGGDQYSRLLKPVRKRTRHVISDLCCPDGSVKQLIHTKTKHKDLYRRIRESNWGDVVPLDISQENRNSDSETELTS